MNRDQKSSAIAEIANQIDEATAIFAVDYRGISVAQAAELRSNLREADALFKVVKNSLTERAADQAGAEALKEYLTGPTALTFVRGDIALAAKALADYARTTQLLPVKGGLMEGAVIDVEQIRALARLPSREVLYGQLVGVVASPVTGLVRTLNALLSGIAVALGQVRDKKESGEIPAGDAPAPEAAAPAPEAPGPETEAHEADADAPAAESREAEAKASEPETGEPEASEPAAAAEPEAASENETAAEQRAEPDQPAQETDDQADAATDVQSEDAEAKSTKED